MLAACFAANSTASPALAAATARVHHAVRTSSAEAQREFDEGLTLMYAFNPEEALGHFQEAARIDGSMAMAYWGIALTAGPNVNTSYDLERAQIGRDASARALQLAARDSEEAAYAAALARRYRARTANDIVRAETDYAHAMGSLANRFPGDLDAQTLYAESLMDLTPLAMWRADGRPARYTTEVIARLREVLRRDPNHLGANHLYIHAWEGSNTPAEALASARRLASLAYEPAEEHLAHMPSHIFMRAGLFDAAIASSLAAVDLCRQYEKTEQTPAHDGYFHHDLQVLEWGYQMTGQWGKARDTATEIAAQVNDPTAAAETYVRFGKYRELLALPAPARPDVRWHFTHGLALAAGGDLSGADRERAYLAARRDDDARTAIARDMLEARLREARGDRSGAIDELRDAVSREDRLRVQEPPAWFVPLRETLGGAQLRAGRFADARRTFEDDLRRNPGNGRSLFGLAQALAHVDAARARAARAKFATAWRSADVALSVDSL